MSERTEAAPGGSLPAPPASRTMQQHVLDALARRAAAHSGEVRRLLDARMAALRATVPVPLAADQAGDDAPARTPLRMPATGGGLAALTGQLTRAAAERGEVPVPPPGQFEQPGHAPPWTALASPPEPHLLPVMRATWARLNAQRRLARSLADPPRNPGPLNSQHLIHRMLTVMREASPGYLLHFMAHVDALAALEPEQAQRRADAPIAARARAGRKPGRKPAS